jgi:transcription termination/antitermination protein NusG
MSAQSQTQTSEESNPRWYIVHAYSGQEERVQRNLELRIETMDVSNKIFEVVVPTEEEIEIKEGQRVPVPRKVFPGYIMVNMMMDDESWHVVRNTPGVTGFVSAEDENEKRAKPVPLEDHEVKNILQQMESATPRVRVGFSKGQVVRITDGPFVDFMGSVDEVYLDRAKVKVLVSFFGRETPVELDFLQVERS